MVVRDDAVPVDWIRATRRRGLTLPFPNGKTNRR
jgi:hypothetical protein